MVRIEQNNDENLKKFVLKGLEENNRQKCQWLK